MLTYVEIMDISSYLTDSLEVKFKPYAEATLAGIMDSYTILSNAINVRCTGLTKLLDKVLEESVVKLPTVFENSSMYDYWLHRVVVGILNIIISSDLWKMRIYLNTLAAVDDETQMKLELIKPYDAGYEPWENNFTQSLKLLIQQHPYSDGGKIQ